MDNYPCVPAWVADPRDRILIAQTPLLPAPTFAPLPPVPLGVREYLGAADGLYVRTRHHALSVTAKLADASMPYGILSSEVRLPGGLIPYELVREIQRAALAHHPKEWAGLVHWSEVEQRYQLTVPRVVSDSTGHISYDTRDLDPERLVLNVHTHGGHPPFFSRTDDESDAAGCYFACVLGFCQSPATLRACVRLVLDGHAFAVSRLPWQRASERAEGLALSDYSEKIKIRLQSMGKLGTADATDLSYAE
ncbi:MAG: PRTRC system protein A [Steroidobacteraceae bacterium]